MSSADAASSSLLFHLDGSSAQASGEIAAVIGRKAAALMTAARLGIAVPEGFVLTSQACEQFLQAGNTFSDAMLDAIRAALAKVEQQTGCTLTGQPPLRLAARISPMRRTMGLADVVLNVGAMVRMNKSEEQASRDPFSEITQAIRAAFTSWNHPLARRARIAQGITDRGLAVIVQQMAANSDGTTAQSHRALTRDHKTCKPAAAPKSLRKRPVLVRAFTHAAGSLERHFKDLVDFEFVCEGDRFLLLDARVADRDSLTNVRVTSKLAEENILTQDQALLRIGERDVMQFLLPSFSPAARDRAELLTQGTAASAGVAVGRPAFTAQEAIERAKAGEEIILVRKETFPEDIEAVRVSAGILTTSGGMTSHAAVVARGWGKCCVVGASEIHVNAGKGQLRVRGRTFTHDDTLSLDGSTGEVFAGTLPMLKQRLSSDLAKLLDWADSRRTMSVLANADTPEDARRSRAFGAQGIGLCRTEHMFFEADRIEAMRQMILADNSAARSAALVRLLPHQKRDFIEIFRAMDGLPVTVRLLDPPLHEFLPQDRALQASVAKSLKIPLKTVQARVAQLHESNPMMGHRGCRLSVTFPEILEMQVRAIVEAAIERRRFGGNPQPRIMHPLVSTAAELRLLRTATLEAIENSRHHGSYTGSLDIPIGTMIEVPRAALLADELAAHADFLSFGTNDLTQLTFGYSRDDSSAFLPQYVEKGLLPRDPFESLDVSGVGALIALAMAKARAVRPEIPVSICGEHGGDAESIAFCQKVGMNAVSCSPFRVPVARLAAGQAAI